MMGMQAEMDILVVIDDLGNSSCLTTAFNFVGHIK